MSKSAGALLKEWNEKRERYEALSGEYMSVGTPPIQRPNRVLDEEGIRELAALRQEVEQARQAYMHAVRVEARRVT